MNIDLLWVMISTILVLMMQGGFLCLESGLTRAKNSINVAIKNMADLILTFLIWWAVGFGLTFGNSWLGLIGSDSFFVEFNQQNSNQAVFFLFQAMFCATAITIISGAIAERTKFNGYLIISAFVAAIVYPLYAHWVWGGVLTEQQGFLAQLGFVDFAGSTVVHSVGGWAALAAVLIIGPRRGVFDQNNQYVPASNLTMAMLAIILFLLGWIGFNAGSTLRFSAEVPVIIVNTIMAAMAGGVGSYLCSKAANNRSLQISVAPLNGMIAGLVAITAGCNVVNQLESIVIGLVAGTISVYGSLWLHKLKIDDAIEAIPVHLMAGIWGTIALAIFGDLTLIGTGLSRWQQIQAQTLGILVCAIWVFPISLFVLWLINKVYSLRVSAQDEDLGLNISEHQARTDLIDFLMAVNAPDLDDDLSKRLPVEPFTEVGQIAQRYNKLMSRVEQAVHKTTTIVEDVQAGIITLDKQANIISANPAAKDIFNVNEQEFIGQPFADLIRRSRIEELPSGDDISFIPWQEIVGTIEHVFVVGRPKGKAEAVYLNIVITASSYSDDEYICLVHDITEQTHAENALFQEKERAKTTLDSIGDGVISTLPNGDIQYINHTAEQLTGWTLQESLNKKLHRVFCAVDRLTEHPNEELVTKVRQYRKAIISEKSKLLFSRSGKVYAIRFTASPIFDRENKLTGIVIVFQDITQSQMIQRKLNYQATHDALTDLFNRREFDSRLADLVQTITERKSDKAIEHILIAIDLDQFKLVNDICGHAAGDELLKQVSKRMKQQIRTHDLLARLGGDEFAILLYNCPLDKAMAIAEKIRASVADYRLNWNGKDYAVTTSIGLVKIDNNTDNVAEVFSQADSACYTSKEKGKNQIYVYQPSNGEIQKRKDEMQWAIRLQQAIDREDDFLLYFQRIVPADNNAYEQHFEILIRMRDSDGGIIAPGAFLPSAERYNYIKAIDLLVIKKAFTWLSQNKANLPTDMTKCSINLSGKSLNDEKLVSQIINWQVEFGIDAGMVCFEITETAAIGNLNQAQQFIMQLKKQGFYFSLDDFGAGLSSFNYLKNLPVDYLKIDGAFVRNVDKDPLDQAMVQSVAAIGKTLGIKTIAEYVENESSVRYLQDAGVDYLQGYHFHKPEPLSEMLLGYTEESELA